MVYINLLYIGFVPGYYAPEVLLPATLDPLALVQRWKQYTQGRAVSRFLGDSLTRRRRHRVARVAFDGWRTGLGPRQRREAKAMKTTVSATASASEAKLETRSEVFSSSAAVAASASASAASVTPPRPSARDARAAAAVAALEKKQEEEEEEEDAQEGGYHGSDGGAGDDDTGFGAGGSSVLRRRGHHEKVTFVEARVGVDLAVARRTVVAGWRSALTRAIGLRQARRERLVKKQGRRHPT